MLKSIRYLLEALAVKMTMWFFYVIGVKRAANLAAKLAQFIGKRLSVNQLAYRNISNALPELSEEEKQQILCDMWDNLGRVAGEYVHIAKLSENDIVNVTQIPQDTINNIEDLKKNNKGGIIFSAHIGNWEVGPKIFDYMGVEINTVYRQLNNPYVEKMTASMRKSNMIPKSVKGNRQIIDVIKSGGYVVIMADQKISEGEPIKFFHDEAITTTSIARVALKYNVPIIPARSIRLGKDFKFKVEVDQPIKYDAQDDVLSVTRKINCKIEEWIKDAPCQWFWVHNRWKK